MTWTIGRLLEWTTGYLAERGYETARLDAEVLLAEARGCERIDLYTAYGEEADERARVAYRELVRRRAEGTPVAYLVGRREFYSLSFRVTPDVLIPRPETELLVVRLLDLVKERGESGEHGQSSNAGEIAIADVGTGSGILAVCAAKYVTHCRVTAIDISSPALDVARANAEDHGVANRIELVQGDLLESVPAGRRFDYILSNPPYVSERELATLAPDVKNHEPRTALVAGTLGTEVIERLVPQAAEHLVPGGHLLVEISPMVEAPVTELIAADNRFEPATVLKDLAGLARVVETRRL